MSDRKTGRRMEAVCRYCGAGFMGLMAGYSLAFVLSRSVWLEMRLTLGYILPLCIIFSIVVCMLRKRPFRPILVLLSELLALFLLVTLYGVSSSTVLIIPGALFRDGFHLRGLPLTTINYLLLLVLGAANGLAITALLVDKNKNMTVYNPGRETDVRGG